MLLTFTLLTNIILGAQSDPKIEVKDKTLRVVRVAMNWVPEPEFGGFYAAQISGIYEKHGLKVELMPGGAGSPTVQMLAAGRTEFAITSASEIATSRSQGSDVVGIYSAFDTSPMGIMVHKSRKIKSIPDLLEKGGTLAIQRGLPFAMMLEKKYGFSKMKIVPYAGGVANFVRDPEFAQQGFLFAEPLMAKKEGAESDFFLLADMGYNSYIEVLAVREQLIKKEEPIVRAMVEASREGWKLYLENPAPANEAMERLNRTMSPEIFSEAAKAQKVLIETEAFKKDGLGVMREDRWKATIDQLVESKSLKKPIEAKSCFVNF